MKTPGFNETSDVAARAIFQAYRPLHVRVAEALGCKPAMSPDGWWHCVCAYSIHDSDGMDGSPNQGGILQAYDTDWSATGPLIERLGISVGPRFGTNAGPHNDSHYTIRDWQALHWEPRAGAGRVGETPLIAVCSLILALAAAGKLPK